MKATGTFKLSKTSKRILATISNKEAAGHYKRMMIEAELAEKVQVRIPRGQRETVKE